MIQFERAQEEDAEALGRVQYKALMPAYREINYPPELEIFEPEYIKKVIRKTIYYKIVDGDRIIGGINVMDQGAEGYLLNEVFVDPEFQKGGIGGRAMEFIQAAIPEAQKWVLYTPNKSFSLHRFYERLGFAKVGELHEESSPEGFFLFRYEKHVVKPTRKDQPRSGHGLGR